MSTTPFTPIPLGLDDFVQGGLLSDVPVEILQIAFRGFDYQGNTEEMLSVWMQLGLLDDNLKRTTDEPVEQYWSAGGKLEEVLLSDDGYQVGVLNSTSKSAMTKGSNIEVFLQSLTKPINGGPAMPKNWLRDNQSSLKCLLGTKFHMLRTPHKREGLNNDNRKRRDQDPMIATATKIYWAPWAPKTAGGKVTKGAGAGATETAAPPVNGSPAPNTQAAPSAPAAGSASDEITTQAVETVKAALAENPIFGSIDELKVQCFRNHAKTKSETRNAIVKLIADAAWLKNNGFKVADDGIVSA